jgi:hypothetical protein
MPQPERRLGDKKIRKFGGVMEDQHRGIGGGEPIARRLKVSGKNLCFADTSVGQETVSGFGVGPVLANQRNALANAIGELESCSKSFLAKTLVESGGAELAADKFTIDPGLGSGGGGVINPTLTL